MTSQPIRLHGYTHAAAGQDPIPATTVTQEFELIEYKAVPQNVTTPQTFSSIDYVTYDHVMVVANLGISSGSLADLVLTWNSGITSYNYTTMVNGSVTSSSNTGSATGILIPAVLPNMFAAGGGAHLSFFFSYIGLFLPLSPHYNMRAVTWEGVGGGSPWSFFQGVGTSGSIPGGAGGLNTEAISSLTFTISGGGGAPTKWEQGSLELYGIRGGAPNRYP